MNLRRRLLGLGVALALGARVVSPAMATAPNAVDVSVNVQDAGGTITFSVSSGSNAAFGNVSVNAQGTSGGLTPAGTKTFTLQMTGDTALYRGAGDIDVTLGDGSAANAKLGLLTPSVPLPPVNAGSVDFQIPGRYLSISSLQNPQQAKYTGSATSTANGAIWDGTFGRAPRVAGYNTVNGQGAAIYKVGDVGGKFDSDASGCHWNDYAGSYASTALVPWPGTCPTPSFSEGHITKGIAYILPGSGTVTTTQDVELSLSVPAGVHPGLYQGQLTVAIVWAP